MFKCVVLLVVADLNNVDFETESPL